MVKRSGAVHVARVVRKYKDREYVSHLLRRSYREDGKIRHETLGNISALPAETIDVIRASLAGKALVVAGEGVEIERSAPHGAVAAIWAQARSLGLPALLGPAGRERDLAMALIVARVAAPGSKLATTRWWADTTLGIDLGVADASSDDVYAAMDWLVARQDRIETTLARRHLVPGGMVLFDLSSSWMEGSHCPLAKRGYSRDHKTGKAQIEYGLMTDAEGRPVAVEVFAGNTADPTAFVAAVDKVRDRFALGDVVMVGDRGMITSARIDAIRDQGGLEWVSALRSPAIKKLVEVGTLQLGLFDEVNLAEISHPDFPDERLVACKNPLLAAERARKRAELLDATETLLAPIKTAVDAGRLAGADKIGLRAGKVIGRYKMAKHFTLTISDTSIDWERNRDQIAAEAALDGIYVIRTSVPAETLDAAAVVAAYKNLAKVERDFRSLKAIDLDLRPVYHRLEDRVRAHVLICMLAAYIVWHLRQAWAPLTFTDETPPTRADPVAPARRSPPATAKASRGTDRDRRPVRSFAGVLDHLATLTRNTTRIGGTSIDILATPTTLQRRAFELIGAPIPTRLTAT
ncbi:MAG: IS1634 family transposase [Pseudonocardiaceae bacterium]